MQWSCPHCGVNLATSDEALGTGWSFSRCYKCGGFALVRKTEINIIKVDKAPPGEKVLLPEATDSPAKAALNEVASQRLMQHMKAKPKTEAPVTQSPQISGIQPPPFNPQSSTQSTTNNTFSHASFEMSQNGLPEPLPDFPANSIKSKAIPAGIIAASFLAIGSGFFLYVQGQALWQKARESAQTNYPLQQNSAELASTEIPLKKESLPPPTLLAHESHPSKNDAVITDQVQKSAMAPTQSSAKEEITHNIRVMIKDRSAQLYSGPGLEYATLGSAQFESQYTVVDWNDRWFKIVIPHEKGKSQIGWVRNDQVQVISPAGKNGVTSPNFNPLRN